MARVTIEDCVQKVEDRFELVALAAQRTRNIASGGELTIERKGEKDTVLSLREIAEETITVHDLREDITKLHQKEKNVLEGFIAPANSNTDSIEIDEEEADIAAAIADSTEAGIEQDDDEEMEGFGIESGEEVAAEKDEIED